MSDHDHVWVTSRLIGRDEKYIVTHVCCLHCEKEIKIGDKEQTSHYIGAKA